MRILPLVFLLFLTIDSFSQDLMDVLKDSTKKTDYTTATFKTVKIVNGKSIENPAPGNLLFIISHHFGQVNSGAYEFFGLDQSTIRLGFEYGINNRLALGIGRSTIQKTFDGYFKFKILRQQTGKKNIPVSVSWLSGMDLISLKWTQPARTNYFTSRLAYTHQLLIARKFNNVLSLQLTPSLVHKNIVPRHTDKNDIFATGFGGRIKLAERVSINAEYFYLLPGNTVTDGYYNSFSVGVDLETGGHVFQLYFTNSQGMFERAFISETTGSWSNGGIFFGFNITRIFTLIPHDD